MIRSSLSSTLSSRLPSTGTYILQPATGHLPGSSAMRWGLMSTANTWHRGLPVGARAISSAPNANPRQQLLPLALDGFEPALDACTNRLGVGQETRLGTAGRLAKGAKQYVTELDQRMLLRQPFRPAAAECPPWSIRSKSQVQPCRVKNGRLQPNTSRRSRAIYCHNAHCYRAGLGASLW